MKSQPLKKNVVGSLSRANKLILGDENSGSSISTLDHWSDKVSQVSPPYGAELNRYRLLPYNRARLLIVLVQESMIKLFFRWFLIEETKERKTQLRPITEERVEGLKGEREKKRKKKQTRSSLLLDNVSELPDKRLTTIVKLIFWRWLTCTNLIELILIVLLFSFCVYQCYELLEEYYSYPTIITINKSMNGDFRQDLPSITLCNNNIMSKESLKQKYPHLNESHYMAITLGTFYSVDNFTLFANNEILANDGESDYGRVEVVNINTTYSALAVTSGDQIEIDWLKVGYFLINDTVSGAFELTPTYDLIDSITCANVWGEHLPCENFKRIESYQDGACVTLFHDSVFWDPEEPAVKELEAEINSHPSIIRYGDHEIFSGSANNTQILHLNNDDSDEFNGTNDQKQVHIEHDESKAQVIMSNMEILRVRLNFRPEDYANGRSDLGGLLSVHSNSVLGMMNHIVYDIKPGFWYSYYIERYDYHRLPAPYSSNCHDYEQNRYLWLERSRWNEKNKAYVSKLIRQQASSHNKLIPEFVSNLRQRSLGRRECISICLTELPITKCNCWPRSMPYVRENNIDLDRKIRWCDYDTLIKEHSNSSNVAGDDLFFQLCIKEFHKLCVDACADECNYSSFDVTQQARSWPSHESRRYISDQVLLDRLKAEAECCATFSIIYSKPVSSLHKTEPKYSRQDMVTIISGNIEAWIGVSAVHAYLFLEQFYKALVEAQLISTPSMSNGRLCGYLISILTNLKVKISQLFTYLFHQLVRLSWSKTNSRVIISE